MKNTIQRQDVTEVSVHEFATEASTMGFPPGASYPRVLKTDLGNKLNFLLTKVSFGNAHYQQELGCLRLTIFND